MTRPIAPDESDIVVSPLKLPTGVVGWLARRLRSLQRTLKGPDVSVLWSNLALLVRPVEFTSYALTLVTMCMDAPHLARRLAFIERNQSRLFVRPLKFLLASVPLVWIGIGLITRWVPAGVLALLPTVPWQRQLVMFVLALFTPAIVATLAPILRVPIVAASWFIPDKHVRSGEAWWSIPFLWDVKTWRQTRRPEVFLYVLYAGPYVILSSLVIVWVVFRYLPWIQDFAFRNPGRLTPEGSVRIMSVVWFGFWGVVAERVCVNAIVSGIPMIMTAPTRFLVRLVIPSFAREVRRLHHLQTLLRLTRSHAEVAGLGKTIAEVLTDIEFLVFFYRRLFFPFATDLSQFYDIVPALRDIKHYYFEDSDPYTWIDGLERAVQGKTITRFGESLLTLRRGSDDTDRPVV